MQIDQAVLIAPGVPLAWHEAVALVGALADALEEGRTSAVPSLEDLALDVNGALRLTSARRSPGGGERAVAEELRGLLGQLLDAAAPAPLRVLAEGSDPDAPQNLAEFIRALAFFARPSRERDLQALAARLATKQEEQRVITEMERLTHKARAHEQGPDATPAPASPAPKRPRWKSRAVLVIGSVGVVIIAIVLTAVSGGTNAASTVAPLRTAANVVVVKLRAVADRFGAGAAASTPVKKTESAGELKPRVQAERHTAKAHPTPEPSRPSTRTVEIFRATEPEVVEVPLWSGVPSDAPALLRTSSKMIFDRHSVDVMPAQLVVPQMTSVAPQVFRGGSGALDVLVGEDGRVERVRLIATTAERRYYDAMILPAVKSWVFRPATRGGRPVRYQLRIPLT